MKQIPNLFTLLNLFFGCLAIVFTLQNGIGIITDPLNPEASNWINMHEKIWLASLFIGLAGVVDFLDGFVARLFNATSAMGKQLDSLADVVSFGVAPGMILYQFLRLSVAREENAIDTSMIWLIPAFLVPCAAAWRLAKFNLDPGQEYSFKGVPTPAVGLMLASLPLIYWQVNEEWVREILLNKWILVGMVLLICYLMVSNIPIMSFKFRNLSVKDNGGKYLLLLIAVASVIFLQWLAVPVIFVAYVLVSLLFQKQIKIPG